MDELDQPFEDGATAIEGSLGHEFQKTWQEALLDFNAPSSISPTDCVEETDPEKIKGAKPVSTHVLSFHPNLIELPSHYVCMRRLRIRKLTVISLLSIPVRQLFV
tara:strand:+ start:108 stop:422 length:315 start_codon:yes stop_codon:yes gene_type:complete